MLIRGCVIDNQRVGLEIEIDDYPRAVSAYEVKLEIVIQSLWQENARERFMQDKQSDAGKVAGERFEMLVGLNVIDEEAYDMYRREMEPMLVAIGAGFGCDFRVKETLRSNSDEPINRFFSIFFPIEFDMNKFFEDATYRTIKAKYFEQAVASTTILAKYRTVMI